MATADTVTDDRDLATQIHVAAAGGTDLAAIAQALGLDPVEVQCRWLSWAWVQHRQQVRDWNGREADAVARRLDRHLEWVGGCDVYRAGSAATPPAWFELVAERLST